MADATVTNANVRWNSGTAKRTVIAGAQIDPGEYLYQDSADTEYKLGDADTDAESDILGMALSDGEDGREMLIAAAGANVDVGFTTIAGTVYVLSTNPGNVAPDTDLLAGDYVVVLFIGNGTSDVTLILAKGTAVHA